MMIAYPTADICCELKEDKILTLVIENQKLFYSMISDIQSQLEGDSGDFVISENYSPLDMRKNVELITQLIPFTINQKELISKLYGSIKKKAVNEEMYQATQDIIARISDYLYYLVEEEEAELTITVPEDISGILKTFDLRFNDSDMTLSEKILEYMLITNDFKGKRVFIIVNLKSYLTDNQIAKFFKSILLKKLQLICIESFEHERMNNEEILIIDKDMCVI